MVRVAADYWRTESAEHFENPLQMRGCSDVGYAFSLS